MTKLDLRMKNPDFTPEMIEGVKQTGLSDAMIRVLYNRGLDTTEKIQKFLNFKPYELRRVESMKGSLEFLNVLESALESNKQITIYGDYDGDGVMATTIWFMGLTEIGHKPHWFVNNRFSEGYGMNVKGVTRLLEQYPDTELIITCDNGIKAIEGVKYAQEHDVQVLISDHHGQSEGEDLPDCPVVCEKRLDESPDGEWFCGAELSRRLVTALYDRMGITDEKRKFLERLYAFSGFATITDSITCNAANHFVIAEGLRQIKEENDYCWQALREVLTDVSRIDSLDEETIGFQYGPMVNAAGRVKGDVDTAMRVFLTSYWCEKAEDDSTKKAYQEACKKSVLELISVNQERQTLSAEGNALAAKMIEENGYNSSKFIVLDSKSFHEGINGLIASRVTETYRVPSLVLCPTETDKDVYKGSARSVEGFNIFEALEQCRDLLLGFGGHPGAAGVSVKKENIPALRQKLDEIANVSAPEPDPTVYVDFILDPKPTENIGVELSDVGPYGEGFSKPTFGYEGDIEDIMILHDRKTGAEKHVRFSVRNEKCSVQVFWWNGLQGYNELVRELGHAPQRLVCTCGAPKYWPSARAKGGIEVKITADLVDLTD